MSLVSQISVLLSFLVRWAPSVRNSRLRIGMVIAAGVASGVINASLIAVMHRAIEGDGASLVWVFFGLCLAFPAARFGAAAILIHLIANAICQMRIELSKRIVAAPMRQLEEFGPHRMLAALTGDIPSITNALAYFPMFLMQLFVILGSLVYMAWLSWVALLGVVIFMAVGVTCYRLPLRRATRYLSVIREKMDGLIKAFQALTEGTKELKLNYHRRRAFFDDNLAPTARGVQDSRIKSQLIFAATAIGGNGLFFVLIGLVIFVLPRYYQLDGEVISGYILAILYMITPLSGLLNSVPTLGAAAVAVKKIEALGLSLSSEIHDGKAELPPAPVAEWRRISLSGVVHQYYREAEERNFALGPMDLTIESGELLFITGGNGSGKTTLAKILTGLYVPEQGEIRIGDQLVTDDFRESYMQLFSAVYSDFFLFERLLGMTNSDLDDQAREYVRKLLLHRKVRIENGVLSTTDLSQGQRKRLALLTAYLEDRPIYLFDEWAADQDPEFKEIFYMDLLPELKRRGKTTIVISHDDRYYPVADRVVKLEGGQIVSADLELNEVTSS